MASVINFEYLPQLVMAKIISFFDHEQLCVFGQVSTSLRCTVDEHFSRTNHLIIGSFNFDNFYYYDHMNDNDKKFMDRLLKVIQRCGKRLRTIQLTINQQRLFEQRSIENYRTYCNHYFAAAEVTNYCPNITNIIVSNHNMFRKRNLSLDEDDVGIWANTKVTTGGTCTLRFKKLSYKLESEVFEHSYELLNLYSNLEQVSVDNPDDFYAFLPKFIENGLKDLCIGRPISVAIAKSCRKIWKLRSLRLFLYVHSAADVADLNKLRLPKNLEIKIAIGRVADCSHLNKTICDSIITCTAFGSPDCNLLRKLKNLKEYHITTSEEQQVIAEGSFPQIRKIQNYSNCTNCKFSNTCESQTFFPQMLTNKGNQLTHIEIHNICNKSIQLVWRALKHCEAAVIIQFTWVDSDLHLILNYEDMEAICDLPNLEVFTFSILQSHDEDTVVLRELLERVVEKHFDFKFDYNLSRLNNLIMSQAFALHRIIFYCASTFLQMN